MRRQEDESQIPYSRCIRSETPGFVSAWAQGREAFLLQNKTKKNPTFGGDGPVTHTQTPCKHENDPQADTVPYEVGIATKPQRS
jgi:hypothetical protein